MQVGKVGIKAATMTVIALREAHAGPTSSASMANSGKAYNNNLIFSIAHFGMLLHYEVCLTK